MCNKTGSNVVCGVQSQNSTTVPSAIDYYRKKRKEIIKNTVPETQKYNYSEATEATEKIQSDC